MYYVVKYLAGRKKALKKRQQDNFGDEVRTSCGRFVTMQSNAQRVRTIKINCSDGGMENGYVYVDNYTARMVLKIV